jgi:hypothetical protein
MNKRPFHKRFWFLLGLSVLLHLGLMACAPEWYLALRDWLARDLAAVPAAPPAPRDHAGPVYHAALHLDRAALRAKKAPGPACPSSLHWSKRFGCGEWP